MNSGAGKGQRGVLEEEEHKSRYGEVEGNNNEGPTGELRQIMHNIGYGTRWG